MRERVSIIQGSSPIIFVAPHGPDQFHTSTIAEEAAKLSSGYAVINRAFRQSLKVDVLKDFADCERIDHLKEDVVYDEYLKPILRIKDKLQHKASERNLEYDIFLDPFACLIVNIQGCDNYIHPQTDELMALIVGYGLGQMKDSFTCPMWRKDCFIDYLNECNLDGDVFEAQGGSHLAGRDSNDFNQFFRKHDKNFMVESIKLTIPSYSRRDYAAAIYLASVIAAACKHIIQRTEYHGFLDSKFI